MDRISGSHVWVAISLILFLALHTVQSLELDPKGYVAYCPCMGRFGNQADHFLGTLAFTHHLDRTLILPPWIEYPYRRSSSDQIPFDTYFQIEPFQEYHRVVTMEEFMKELAPTIWPDGERIGFCYKYRQDESCMMKEGNPFGPFWNNFEINFESYAEFGRLSYATEHPSIKLSWEEKFPVEKFPVLAFAGAPAAFPVAEPNVHLHKYLKWSDLINDQADKFIDEELSGGPFLGIHMRHGSDWESACKHVDASRHLFATPQCLGYNFEHGKATDELCLPPMEMVLKTVKKMMKKIKATGLFVASDSNPHIDDFKSILPSRTKVVRVTPAEPHVELAILAKADHYIGNCASTFSAFAKRERDVVGKPSSFWGFDPKAKQSKKATDEL